MYFRTSIHFRTQQFDPTEVYRPPGSIIAEIHILTGTSISTSQCSTSTQTSLFCKTSQFTKHDRMTDNLTRLSSLCTRVETKLWQSAQAMASSKVRLISSNSCALLSSSEFILWNIMTPSLEASHFVGKNCSWYSDKEAQRRGNQVGKLQGALWC